MSSDATTTCADVMDDLAALVDGDEAVVARHAEHLAGCDACRDARHEASAVADVVRVTAASGYVQPPIGELVERLMAKIEDKKPDAAMTAEKAVKAVRPAPAPSTPKAKAAKTATTAKRGWLVGAAAAASALAAASIAGVYLHAPHGDDGAIATPVVASAAIGKIEVVEAAGKSTSGLVAGAPIAAGATLRTDERTRVSLTLADGTHLTLDHATTLAFDRAEPRRVQLAAGRLVADVAHVDGRPAAFATPSGTVEVVGTRFELTATEQTTSVQVVRGAVVLRTAAGTRDDVRAGEEGTIDHGALSVAAAPQLAHEIAWSELSEPGPAAAAHDDVTAGLGSLRAYKPGESRDRDWNLALAHHDVHVRIVGPIARTEITETFRNDSAATLEGVYQFPLPADAQIEDLALDVPGREPIAFNEGAFVDKTRAKKIWDGVIQHATPHPIQPPTSEIIWVPGRWRDPAMLDWQRGGRFELRVFPIPAKGARTIKLAYTQVVTPRGDGREYIYPLAHSRDGSTVADDFSFDVEVRGAARGSIRSGGYDLVADPARGDVGALSLHQGGFVPRGDLAIDYRPADGAELRAWTFAGGAAALPDETLAKKHGVGIDPAVVAAQRAEAQDLRPTAVLALRPLLPRWRAEHARDYAIVVDRSQSMIGERETRAADLVTAMIGQMDRRDRVTLLACDSACRRQGDPRVPSPQVAADARAFLAAEPAAGASDLVASIRDAAEALPAADGDREKWILFVGDGFATTGFRRASDVERALASTTRGARVSTIGIGGDADTALLAAAARAGGGSYLAWLPGETVAIAALAALESTDGSALRGATIELPAGLAEVTPSALPTLRAGEETLLAARVTGAVDGDVVVRGTVGGEAFEQRYPLHLAVSSAAGNAFVPRLWASLAIDELERGGSGADRARIVALSQGYGVMSRETSLLVLESQAMFDAFGVDRHAPAATWTGEEAIDEASAIGAVAQTAAPATAATQGFGHAGGGGGAYGGAVDSAMDEGRAEKATTADKTPTTQAAKKDERPMPVTTVPAAPTPQPTPTRRPMPQPSLHHSPPRPPSDRAVADNFDDFEGPRHMVPMIRTWVRVPSVTPYDGVNPAIAKAVTEFDAELVAHPDSREAHRALVQALSYSGDLDRARDVAARWLDRDRLDPQALGYEADLLGRAGQRDLALRTLAGLVDLDADHVALHERMVRAYEAVGRRAQACGHRIAIATLQPKDVAAAGRAATCLRSLGRAGDAELVLAALPDNAARAAAEKAGLVPAIDATATGELVADAHWTGGADLDLSLVTPDGTRVSWMGGREGVVVTDATATDRERLALRSLKRGNYLIEVSRVAGSSPATIRGTLDVTALGERRALPFELAGDRVVVGRISIALEAHLEPCSTTT